jgi:phospholipid-binding lipoprotein MlaA
MMNTKKLCRWMALMLIATTFSGCAVVMSPNAGKDPRDPYERYNRSMFSFNQELDKKVLKPVATAYADYTPDFLQTVIGNFFSNIGDVWTAANNFLQGKPRDGTTDAMRVVFNSTIGLAGLLDIATPAGLPKHEEDFGQTLGVWGVKSGPYVVLPVLGSSTMRDATAKPIDWAGDPLGYVDNIRARNSGRAIRIVDDRAALLEASKLMEGAALDPYEFMRDAYLQRRASRINDQQ